MTAYARAACVALVASGCGQAPEGRKHHRRDHQPPDPPQAPIPSCTQVGDNVLLWQCTADLGEASSAEAWVADPSGARRVLPATSQDGTLQFAVWRIRANTDYTVGLTTDSGLEGAFALHTGPLPDAVALAATVSGQASFDALLMPIQCDGPGMLALVDTQGEVLWYLDVGVGMPEGPAPLTAVGFDPTEDGVVVDVGRTRIRRWSWTQDLQFDLSWPEDLPYPPHHDLIYRDGRTYALVGRPYTAANGRNYVMDGLTVLDADGTLLAQWDLTQEFEPTGWSGMAAFWADFFPGYGDWAHLNGVDLFDDGGILVSSRHHDSLFRIDGDWDGPSFGALEWSATQDPESPFGNDFSFLGDLQPLDYVNQHHPYLTGDGGLLVFDTRVPPEQARATVWKLDTDRSELTLEQAWSMGRVCAVRGSIFPVADHVVAACIADEVLEFAPGSALPVWSLQMACANGSTQIDVPRAVPITF